jgi:hypothetical protein
MKLIFIFSFYLLLLLYAIMFGMWLVNVHEFARIKMIINWNWWIFIISGLITLIIVSHER